MVSIMMLLSTRGLAVLRGEPERACGKDWGPVTSASFRPPKQQGMPPRRLQERTSGCNGILRCCEK